MLINRIAVLFLAALFAFAFVGCSDEAEATEENVEEAAEETGEAMEEGAEEVEEAAEDATD